MTLGRNDLIFILLALACLPTTFLDHDLWKMAVNPLPTLWLVWLAYRHTRERFGLTITLGVACGALGDALLAPVQESLFLPGALAFLVGHCFYIAGFLRGTGIARNRLWIALPLGIYALAMAWAVHGAMSARGEGMLFIGVAVYLCMLVVTTIIGFARAGGSWLVAGGVLVFLVSDSHIAFNNLIFAEPASVLVFSGMATYYAAQYLIVRGCIGENDARPVRLAPPPPSPRQDGNPGR